MTSSADHPDSNQRVTALFTGTVQGVGFRYRTIRIADGYNVTGYVKNLPDGRVELVAEGAKMELDRFVKDVQDTMAHFIRDAQINHSPATGQYTRFDVAH